MTVEQFEREYAERSGVTVEFLRQWGRHGELCDCDEEICEGFQMAHSDCALPNCRLRVGTTTEGEGAGSDPA